MGVQTQTDEKPGLDTEAGREALLSAAARLKVQDKGDEKPDDGDEKPAEDEGPDGAPAGPDAAKEKEPEAEKKEEGVGKGFAALKHEQRRIHAEAEKRQKELDEREAQIAEDMKAVSAVAAAAEVFLVDPIPVAHSLGAKTADDFFRLGRAFYVQHARLAGKPIPPEWDQELRAGSNDVRLRQADQRFEQLEKRIDDKLSAREKAAFESEYRAELKVAASGIDEEASPHVYSLMREDPDEVVAALYAIADDMVRQGHQEIPDPAELIETYEANLAKELARFGGLYERKKQQKAKGSKGQQGGSKKPMTNITPNLSTEVRRSATKGRRTEEEKMSAAVGHLRTMVHQMTGNPHDD